MNEINLLPDDYIKKRATKPKQILKICAVIAVMTFAILLSKTVINQYQQLKTVTAHADKIYNEDITPLIEKEQRLRQIETDIAEKYNLYLELKNQKNLWSEVLLEIAETTPKNVQIKDIVADNDKGIVISGHARSDTDIAQFMINLSKASNFKDINLNYITTEIGQSDKDILTFQITFFLKKKGGI